MFFEGNAYLDNSFIINSTVASSAVFCANITGSTLNMLSTSGNYQNITNVATPILANDAAIKSYVDALGITILDYNLSGTSATLISSELRGSFVITVTNYVNDGPSAVFNITKNKPVNQGSVQRTVGAPGDDTVTMLDLFWDPNSGISLFKTSNNYNGTYRVKIM